MRDDLRVLGFVGMDISRDKGYDGVSFDGYKVDIEGFRGIYRS